MVVLTFVVIIIVDIIAVSMARNVATLLLLFAYGSCMEMRETVERMVMVRTTGSDLQPAATGYIYKKESDGPASVTKMGESEVIEHFSKLYGPTTYKAKEEDDDKAASHASEEVVKPVVEAAHEDDHIDGIANEDYSKIFEEYAKQFGNYKDDFADYLHGVGHYDHGIYHGYGGGKDYGSKDYHRYGENGNEGHKKQYYFGKGGAGDYHTEKHEGYSALKEGGHKHDYDDADHHGKHYGQGHGYKGEDHGHKAGYDKGEKIDGFHKVFDKNEFKKDHDLYDGDSLKGGHHKYGSEHAAHGSDAGGYEKGESHKSGHHKGDFEKGGYVDKHSGDEKDAGHSAEESEESGHHKHRGFGVKGELNDGKSYGYAIKH